ncbi:metalloendopeptidase [Entomophthora muscae]|uniref:Metalloendopeptidase n=1 Tax=Entomophthora muscae TaxID=34485 RepID=A0ACC2UHL7_9FUNG|nr:metalloendopeptidase [Entomophthora muscae]
MTALIKITRLVPSLIPRSLLQYNNVSYSSGPYTSGSYKPCSSSFKAILPKSQFHTSNSNKAPLLLPPLMVKGAYYATRLGISFSPFIYKSRLYRAYPKTTKFSLLFFILSSGFVLLCSLDKNPYTGRRRLLLLDQETSSFYEEIELANKLANTRFSEKLELLWGDCSLKLLENLARSSDLSFDKTELEVQFINTKEIELIFSQKGVLYVSHGFLTFIKGDSMLLAAGISHLLAHYACHHSSEASGKTAFFSICLDVVRSALYFTMGHFALLSDLAGIGISQLQTHTLDSPFQKKLELEANVISLHLMARAGYNPASVIAFWEKLCSLSKEPLKEIPTDESTDSLVVKASQTVDTLASLLNQPTGFHALHPCSEKDISILHKALEAAMRVYKLSTKRSSLDPLINCPHLKESLYKL